MTYIVIYSILIKSCFIYKSETAGRRVKRWRTTPPAGSIEENLFLTEPHLYNCSLIRLNIKSGL